MPFTFRFSRFAYRGRILDPVDPARPRLVTANRGVIAALSRVYYRKLDFSWPRQSIKRFPPADGFRSAVVHVRSIPHVRHCFGKACNRLTGATPVDPRSTLDGNFRRSPLKAPVAACVEKLTDSLGAERYRARIPRKANKSHLERASQR